MQAAAKEANKATVDGRFRPRAQPTIGLLACFFIVEQNLVRISTVVSAVIRYSMSPRMNIHRAHYVCKNGVIHETGSRSRCDAAKGLAYQTTATVPTSRKICELRCCGRQTDRHAHRNTCSTAIMHCTLRPGHPNAQRTGGARVV